MKVPELKKLLQGRELPVAGNKADLIARLQQDDEKKDEGAPKPAGGGKSLFFFPPAISFGFRSASGLWSAMGAGSWTVGKIRQSSWLLPKIFPARRVRPTQHLTFKL